MGHTSSGSDAPKQVSISDVASLAGTSTATVSRALRHDPRVAPTTRARVTDIAERLGYMPSAPAAALATGKKGFIGVLTPTLQDAFYAEATEGAFAAAASVNYGLCMLIDDHETGSRTALRNCAGRIDALLVLGDATTAAHAPAGLPTLLSPPRMTVGGNAPRHGPGSNYRQLLTAAAVQAHAQGYKKTALVTGTSYTWITNNDPTLGTALSLLHGKLEPPTNHRAISRQQALFDNLAAAAGPEPCALICSTNDVAVGALERHRLHRVGVRSKLGVMSVEGQLRGVTAGTSLSRASARREAFQDVTLLLAAIGA